MAGQHFKGGYDVQFCSELNEDYVCCICHLAFRDPCQLECGHQFCTSCIKSCKRTLDGHRVCPIDRHTIDMDKVFPDKAIARKVLSLRVKCKNDADGCDWTGDLRAFEEHVKKCKYEYICCENEGCETFHQRRFLQEHLSLHCLFRVIVCCHCEEDYIMQDEKDHLDECIKVPIECNNDCGVKFPRNEMVNHLEICPLEIVNCSYADVGCQHKCKRSLRIVHEEDELQSHLKFAMEKVGNLHNELEKHKKVSMEKFRILEDKLKHVEYVWPITNYHSQLIEARTTDKEMESSPFFTSKYGYKVRLSANLNDTNVRKLSGLTVFFEIMRGEYDAILKWPFVHKYTLSVLHENELKNKKLIFDPKTDDNCLQCFIRPTDKANTGFGCFLISHIDIEDEGFLIDDTIFIKCEIEVSS